MRAAYRGFCRTPIASALERPEREDHEYVHRSVAEIFLEVEPLIGKRHLEASKHGIKMDWAQWTKAMLDDIHCKPKPFSPPKIVTKL